jgi:hypothetical protein
VGWVLDSPLYVLFLMPPLSYVAMNEYEGNSPRRAKYNLLNFATSKTLYNLDIIAISIYWQVNSLTENHSVMVIISVGSLLYALYKTFAMLR